MSSEAEQSWGVSFGGLAAAGAEVYDRVMVPRMFEPWARLLVDRLEVAAGEAVLDVACGPGSVTRILAGRVGETGRVTGCDLSEPMLALARTKPATAGDATIDYHQASADRLPVPDGSYDVVTCQQGLQFFPDRLAALREMRRTLRAGGRVGIVVWTSIENSPPFDALAAGVEEIAGEELAQRYRNGPFGLTDARELSGLLADAGFDDVHISQDALPVSFAGPAQVVATLAVTPLAAEVDRLTPSARQQLVAAVARRTGEGAIESQLEANIAFARR
jgi:ubiquinone/menaquinone biosynthesis C-methylase UbiE